MLISVLTIICSGILLIFGVFISASFLNLIRSKKSIIVLIIFCIMSILLQFICFLVFGYNRTENYYPLIVHLPLIVLYVIFFKKSFLNSVFAVLSAYLCCQVSKWIGILAEGLTDSEVAGYIVRIVFLVISGYFVIRYVAPSMAVILSKSKKSIYTFLIIPAAYYVFDYVAAVYTDLLYSGKTVVFEFLPFILCIAYFTFCIVYFKTYEESVEAERYRQLMEIQRAQSIKEIEAIKRSEYATSLLRHDMRHFLSNISSLIDKNDLRKANEYIHEIIAAVDRASVQRYCGNDIVNMIISSYEKIISDNDINLALLIQIPDKLPISDIDITSILSNGLENAVKAVIPLSVENRNIELMLCVQDTTLLLSIKNTFPKTNKKTDTLLLTGEPGHGFGTQSIRYVTEKLKGHCQFTVQNDMFIMRAILPLNML